MNNYNKGERVLGTVHASTMPTTICKKDCCRNMMDQDEIPTDIREANAKVVGARFMPHGPNDHSHPPGIDSSVSVPYRNVFFGAPREYGPDEGWQYVSYKKKGCKLRRYRDREYKQPELEVSEEDY